MDKPNETTRAHAATPSVAAQKKRPAVSVVVPCYNGGRFLDRLMVSLGQQTFRNFEIIIVDDGSSEPETLDKLAALKDAARVIHQDNRGLPAARNAGIAAARADLVMPLDCDDTLEPPFLEEAVAQMRAAPPDVAAVFSHLRLVDAGSGFLERHFNRFDLLFSNSMPAGLLLRKSAWQAAGGYDEMMRDGYEDWEFYLRLARMGYRALVIPKPYFLYDVSRSGMLFSHSSARHAMLWRRIRHKHAEAYRPMALLRAWWQSRDGTGRVSLAKALAAYALTALLPDAWYTRLVTGLRRRRLLEGRRAPYREAAAKSPFAA
jgi:glycosyltransferase involved in cell wall biosynthesis